MQDICNFVPAKGYESTIAYYHFVYETELKNLIQPFLRPCYYLHLVVRGSGMLKVKEMEYPLEAGTVFVMVPYQAYQISGTDNFTYLYISFGGDGVKALLESHGITDNVHVFVGLNHIIDFWMNSIRRFTPQSANAITESVFMYTLSYLTPQQPNVQRMATDKFSIILEFLNNHYHDKDLTLKSVANLFFYSEKYFSTLFKQNMKINFSQYLNKLRVQHAIEEIWAGNYAISELAVGCGFADAMYFSKVFKKIAGKTPTEFIKDTKKKHRKTEEASGGKLS